jgi:hypothetical protein
MKGPGTQKQNKQRQNPLALRLQKTLTLTDDGGAIGDAFRIGGRDDSQESNRMGEPNT